MFWNIHEKYLTVWFKPIITEEIFYDGYPIGNISIDIKKIKNIVKALSLMDYPLKSIKLKAGTFIDMDTPYYHGFPENTIEKLWNKIHNWRATDTEIFIKNNHLYTSEDGFKIKLPDDMFSDFDTKELQLTFYWD